jgi:hypothetical protein
MADRIQDTESILWNWNSLNSQSFIFVRVEGRERHAGKSTMYSATYTS